ncbi:MAG: hypothetical protein HYR56_26740 [Acidobacteria bacterium]|nr:hypothetical protein [Acidobacteriota bacterium]MBI3422310.1 hypothetical protein [Acidobacteriota bacterium]
MKDKFIDDLEDVIDPEPVIDPSLIWGEENGPGKRRLQASFISDEAVGFFEKLAAETWNDLRRRNLVKTPLLETTITNILMAKIQERIKYENLRDIRQVIPKSSEEAVMGFDWEWWVGSGNRWFRYVVQAKILSRESLKYEALCHRVKSSKKLQIDVLKDFADRKKAIPLYCFYNYLPNDIAESYWHCPPEYQKDISQLGCTLVPLEIVKPIHDKRIAKRFIYLHESPQALPWRCLFHAHLDETGPPEGEIVPPYARNYWDRKYDELPKFLQEAGSDRPVSLPPELYEGCYPERIMIIQTNDKILQNSGNLSSEIGPLP